MTLNTSNEITLVQVVKTTKILQKLFDSFSKSAKEDSGDLLNQNYFNHWVSNNLTLPSSVLSADDYSFRSLPSASPLTTASTVLMPLALEGLLSGKVKPDITKTKSKTYTLTFLYNHTKQIFEHLDSPAEAVQTFEKFKKTETVSFYLGLTTLHEQKLFRYLLDPVYVSGDVNNSGQIYPSREEGRLLWQYNVWVRLTAGLRGEGIESENNLGLRTTNGKFVHCDLLDYQRFYPLISRIRSLTDVRDAVLVHDFFNDGFINADSLFYLPKRLIQNYAELNALNSRVFNLTTTGYRTLSTNHLGINKHLGTFKTLEEARETYRTFKFKVVVEVFNIYRGFLPFHFCERFDKHLNFLNAGDDK